MAGENDPAPKPDEPKTFTQAELEQKIGERLKREREQTATKYADYEELKAKAAAADQADEAGKGETEKLTGQIEKLTKQLDQQKDDLAGERTLRLKAEVAASKGLTPAQAKRLTGTSQEELEADADDLLEAFPTPKKDDGDDGEQQRRKGPPSSKPREALKAGKDDPDGAVEETDPAKLAAEIPRR